MVQKVLSEDTVVNYLKEIYAKAENFMPEGYTTDMLSDVMLALDAKGLEKDGEVIKNIIAGIGEESEKVAASMHFTGITGAVIDASNYLEEMKKQLNDASTGFDKLTIAQDGFLRSNYYDKKRNP